MKLLIPPPIIATLLGVPTAVWLRLGPKIPMDFEMRLVVVMILFCLAAAIGVTAITQFRKLGTTIDPVHPEQATRLATKGIFAISRNPMYLSLLTLVTACAVGSGVAAGFFAPIAFFAWMQRVQIPAEESALYGRFKEEFVTYCSQTRRWL